MNGIQLKPTPKYTKTEFDEDDVSEASTFPADIVTGIGNPNLSVSGQQLAGQSQDYTHKLSNQPKIFYKQTSINLNRGRKRNWWDRSSPYEKLLLLTIGFLCLIIGILIITLASQSDVTTLQVHVKTSQNQSYCLTPACVTVASTIINAMDQNIDPCVDFYQYSCGGWIKANPLPDGKSVWGTFGKLWQENQIVMKNVLEDDKTISKSAAERKARIYYHSCLDKNETIEKTGPQPMHNMLKEIGGWNISGKFDLKDWDFQKTLEKLHNYYNRGGLFNWGVGADEKNSTRNVIQLDQSGLGLPNRDYYLNKSSNSENVLKAYFTFMVKVGVLLGGEEESTEYQMEQVLNFEKKLAEITIPADERRDDERMYHKMRLKDLNEICSVINWVQYFEYAFKQINRSVTEDESIVIYSPEYMRNLSALIEDQKKTEEGKIVLANYLAWSVVQSLTSCLSKPFREASKILRKALMGSEGSESPWRYCVSDTNGVMGFALGAMFVRAVFHGESKQMAQAMIEEIRNAFIDNLPHLKWMDQHTRDLAKDKAKAITDMIGFPDFILDHDKLDQKYHGLEFNESQYFENNIQVNRFALLKNLQKIDKLANKSEWEMTPPTVNAYYTPTKNQIVFPAGILQAPFYDVNYPKSLNFGAMGVVMGHELTHAFDDQGREYDKQGNLHKWWKNSTIKQFEERMKCFIGQYSNYKINNDHVNGKQTLGENVADNGGLAAAFHAYKDWLNKNKEELPLPGVNLTNFQLFFVGFSQVWCSTSTPESMKLQIVNDPHSPAQYRVIGTLSNSIEFAETFRCKPNTPMNPNKKCVVW